MTVQEHLRDTANNIHSRGPTIAAEHLRLAADRIEDLEKQLKEALHNQLPGITVIGPMRNRGVE